jgi:hypothetical protein
VAFPSSEILTERDTHCEFLKGGGCRITFWRLLRSINDHPKESVQLKTRFGPWIKISSIALVLIIIRIAIHVARIFEFELYQSRIRVWIIQWQSYVIESDTLLALFGRNGRFRMAQYGRHSWVMNRDSFPE